MARADSGAGVILVENYYNNYNDKMHKGTVATGPRGSDIQSYAFVLFRDVHTRKYSDGGGGVDASDITLENTAVRELKEESCNLFRLHSSTLVDKAIKVKHYDYSGYFLRIYNPGNTFTADYTYNYNLIRSRLPRPHAWLETDAICRVYIGQLLLSDVLSARGDLITLDSLFNPITIDGKTKALIRLYLEKLGLDKESPYDTIIRQIESTLSVALLHTDNCTSRSHPFVDGTHSFYTPSR